MRTILSFLLALVCVFGPAVTAFAQEATSSPDGTETVTELTTPATDSDTTEGSTTTETLTEPDTATSTDSADTSLGTTTDSSDETSTTTDFVTFESTSTTTDATSTALTATVTEATSTEATTTSWTIAGVVDLSNGCAVTDTDGVSHVFPAATTSAQYLAVCALAKAVEDGTITQITVQNSSFGLYLTSVNGTAAASNEYWALWDNGGYASCGIDCLELHQGDALGIVRTDFSGNESDRLTLTIATTSPVYDNIILPAGCSLTDDTGGTHTYPNSDSPSDYLAACALEAAKEQGYISDFDVTAASFGLYVSGMNGTAAASDEYWALWENGNYASCGIECLPLSVGDTLSFVLTNFDGTEGQRYDLHVIGTTTASTAGGTDTGDGGSGSAGGNTAPSFDVSKAYTFLASGQSGAGSWDSDLVTDWSTVALGISGAPSGMKAKLASYLRSHADSFSDVRDNERRALALMALNINPYSGTSIDYITPIANSFDGTQIGYPGIVNDDVFALITLIPAGYDRNSDIVTKTVDFISAQQKPDGSWEESVDLTAAAIQALTTAGSGSAVARGEAYLHSKQLNDGSWNGDPFSTSWTLQAIAALGESASQWSQGSSSPLTYLANQQQGDGGLTTTPSDYSTRAWATAYAIPAVKGLTWSDVLHRFNEPATGGVKGAASSTDATASSTDAVATTTESVATTTENILPVDLASTTATTTPGHPDVPSAITHAHETTAEDTQSKTDATPNAQHLIAGAAGSGAWEWLKHFFAGMWHFLTGWL